MQNFRTLGLIIKKVRNLFNLSDKYGKIIQCEIYSQFVRDRTYFVHESVLKESHCGGMQAGLPEVQILVYLHLLPDTPVAVPLAGPGLLANVPQYGGALSQGQVSVNQHWQLLERQLWSLHVFSSEQLETDLFMGNLGTVQQ